MSRPIKRGSTDQSVVIRIIDQGDGTPEMAVSSGTAGIDLWYRREGAATVNITETSLAALTTAHTDGGIILIDDGHYRIDIPDAAFAASVGVDGVLVGGAVTSMIVIGSYYPLVNYDPYGTVFLTTGAIMASNFAAAAVNSTVLGVSLGDILADTNELQTDWVNGGRLDLLIDALGVAEASLVAHQVTQNVAIASLLVYATSILGDTVELQTDWTNGGRLDLILDAAGAAGDPWITSIPGSYGAGTAGFRLGQFIDASISSGVSPPTAASVAAAVFTVSLPGAFAAGTAGYKIGQYLDASLSTIDGVVDSILADSNELQTDWTNGGRLDLLIDAILSDTGTSLVTILSAQDVALASLVTHATTISANVLTRASAAAYTSTRAGYLDRLNSYLDASVSTIDTVVDSIYVGMDQGIIANASLDNVEFPMVDNTDHRSPKTGLTVLGYRSINGGAFASLSAAVSEVGNGIYVIDLLPADTNGGIITYRFSGTGADDSILTIRTTSG